MHKSPGFVISGCRNVALEAPPPTPATSMSLVNERLIFISLSRISRSTGKMSPSSFTNCAQDAASIDCSDGQVSFAFSKMCRRWMLENRVLTSISSSDLFIPRI